MKIINIDIAGYIIQVRIYDPYSSSRLENDINDLYQSFIIPRNLSKINFYIDIYNKPFSKPIKIIRQTVKKKIDNYLYFFEEKGNRIKTYYYISINQFVSILVIVLQKLLVKSKSFILHASAFSIKNKAFLFTGPSGTGKSTIIKQLKNKYRAIADDTVIIKKENNHYNCYQTPFTEKNFWFKKENKKFSIGKIYILKKANYYRIINISNKKYIITNLASQLFTNNFNQLKQMNNLSNFINTFDEFYQLYFMKDSNPKMLGSLIDTDNRK